MGTASFYGLLPSVLLRSLNSCLVYFIFITPKRNQYPRIYALKEPQRTILLTEPSLVRKKISISTATLFYISKSSSKKLFKHHINTFGALPCLLQAMIIAASSEYNLVPIVEDNFITYYREQPYIINLTITAMFMRIKYVITLFITLLSPNIPYSKSFMRLRNIEAIPGVFVNLDLFKLQKMTVLKSLNSITSP